MLLVIHADSQPEWLPGLLEPLRDYQRRLLANAGMGVDTEALQRREARIRAEREHFVANDRFPEKSHLDYFDHQLRQIKAQSRRLFFVENPLPGTLLDLFMRSPDQSLTLTWTNPHSFIENWLFWKTAHGKQEGDLVSRALQTEMFAPPNKDGGLILERPCLSGIAVCDHERMKELVVPDGLYSWKRRRFSS
jgi:hypothetical protein